MSISVNDKLKVHYDHYYDGPTQWRWLGAIDKSNNILSLCQGYDHERILEIGAGEGSVLKRLSDLSFGKEFYALEISASAIEAVKKRNIKSLVECKSFDGYNVPYLNRRFDLVVLSHVVEHVEHPRLLLYEAKRVGKYVFIEVPLEDTWRLKKDFEFDKLGHINFYSPKIMRRFIQSCGLKILKEGIRNRAFDLYKHQHGFLGGLLRYLPKEILIQLFPSVATRIFTYHGFYVCEDSSRN